MRDLQTTSRSDRCRFPATGRTPTWALVLSVAVLVGACGGGGDESGPDVASDQAAAEIPAEPAEDDQQDAAAPEATPVPSDTSEPGTDTDPPPESTQPPEPTVPAAAPLPDIGVEDVPDLIVDWAAAADDASVGPLDIARRLIGFPLAVPVPEGATAFRVDLDVFTGDPGVDWHWEWRYSAFANAPIGDIDITLDDNGPGTVELSATYDPIMADMGWRRTGTTASDPGDPGGPNSVNHVYSYEGETLNVGGTLAKPDPTFVWLDEDLVFGDEENPGYQIDVNLDLPPDVIVVPLVASLHAALPAIDGSRVIGIDVSSWERDPDSFAADEGLRYLELRISIELPPGSEEAAIEAYAGLEGDVYRAGEESFFDPGFHEPADATVSGGTWRQAILLLDRYPGSISVASGSDGEPSTATLEITLEPNRELLQPLPG